MATSSSSSSPARSYIFRRCPKPQHQQATQEDFIGPLLLIDYFQQYHGSSINDLLNGINTFIYEADHFSEFPFSFYAHRVHNSLKFITDRCADERSSSPNSSSSTSHELPTILVPFVFGQEYVSPEFLDDNYLWQLSIEPSEELKNFFMVGKEKITEAAMTISKMSWDNSNSVAFLTQAMARAEITFQEMYEIVNKQLQPELYGIFSTG